MRALTALGVMLAAVAAGSGLVTVPADAAGILPPDNPPSNIAPSSNDYLTSIDTARSAEGLGPMEVSESQLTTLPLPEQEFIVLNIERIDRGLPVVTSMTSQLDGYAQQAADGAEDPSFPSALTGGAPVTFGGSIWAGGMSSVLEADYFWMYDDGWGGLLGSTSNATCSLLSLGDCWDHRDVVLHSFPDCPGGDATLSMGAAYSPTGYAGGSIAGIVVSSCSPPSDVTLTWDQALDDAMLNARTVGIATLSSGTGYWEAEADGSVAAFGTAQNFGSMSSQSLNAPIVSIAATPDGGGYWLVASDGGIFSFGDARFYGSTGSLRLNKPIVGIASSPDGGGYWMVASDGGIFSFGDAPFRGSTGNIRLNQPIVGMSSDPTTDGYWLVAADGGIFSFGAPFLGSTGNIRLNRPIVGMASTPDGQGYRMVASDGGIFTFGDATFRGSMGGVSLVAPVADMAPDNATNGYWLAAADGGIFTFGGASFLGRVVSSLL